MVVMFCFKLYSLKKRATEGGRKFLKYFNHQFLIVFTHFKTVSELF